MMYVAHIRAVMPYLTRKPALAALRGWLYSSTKRSYIRMSRFSLTLFLSCSVLKSCPLQKACTEARPGSKTLQCLRRSSSLSRWNFHLRLVHIRVRALDGHGHGRLRVSSYSA